MGFVTAIGRCYARIVTFSGRARRAEYWWFFLYQILLTIAVQGLLLWRVMDDPAFLAAISRPDALEAWLADRPQMLQLAAIAGVGWLVLVALPNLTVTVRRLHDTNHRGWMILMPTLVGIVSGIAGGVLAGGAAASGSGGMAALAMIVMTVPTIIASIWLFVLMVLPGTEGPNRFGPDPVADRAPAHPAFARPMDGVQRVQSEEARKAAMQDYYQRRVLPSIQRPEQG